MGQDTVVHPGPCIAIREDEQRTSARRLRQYEVLVPRIVAPLPKIRVARGALDAPSHAPSEELVDGHLFFSQLGVSDCRREKARVVFGRGYQARGAIRLEVVRKARPASVVGGGDTILETER